MPGTSERITLPLEVCVHDTGPGVPEELRPNIFDPFVTTKPGGKGLGLALVAKIVRDHGGIIECVGPRARHHLPRAAAHAARRRPRPVTLKETATHERQDGPDRRR